MIRHDQLDGFAMMKNALPSNLQKNRTKPEATAFSPEPPAENAEPLAHGEMYSRWMFDKFGPTLGMEELAAVLHNTVGTLDQKIRTGQCPVPTYKEGGHRVADLRDVIVYLNSRRTEAQESYKDIQKLLELPPGL